MAAVRPNKLKKVSVMGGVYVKKACTPYKHCADSYYFNSDAWCAASTLSAKSCRLSSHRAARRSIKSTCKWSGVWPGAK